MREITKMDFTMLMSTHHALSLRTMHQKQDDIVNRLVEEVKVDANYLSKSWFMSFPCSEGIRFSKGGFLYFDVAGEQSFFYNENKNGVKTVWQKIFKKSTGLSDFRIYILKK